MRYLHWPFPEVSNVSPEGVCQTPHPYAYLQKRPPSSMHIPILQLWTEWVDNPSPMDKMTDTGKNITLPQTSFASGKIAHLDDWTAELAITANNNDITKSKQTNKSGCGNDFPLRTVAICWFHICTRSNM